jgi:hypothetical protein
MYLTGGGGEHQNEGGACVAVTPVREYRNSQEKEPNLNKKGKYQKYR